MPYKVGEVKRGMQRKPASVRWSAWLEGGTSRLQRATQQIGMTCAVSLPGNRASAESDADARVGN